MQKTQHTDQKTKDKLAAGEKVRAIMAILDKRISCRAILQQVKAVIEAP